MQPSELIAAVDEEIARLEQARALLSASGTGAARRGQSTPAFSGGTVPRKRRRISAAGRARIVAAQKARWAMIRKAAGQGNATVPAKAAATPKTRKAVKKASVKKASSKKRASSRRAPAKVAAPAAPAAAAEASSS